MRSLYFCRHAKSDWSDGDLADHDRPLNARGERNAPLMARLFRERNEMLDLLVSSTAVRAITTARVFARELGAAERDSFDPAAPRPQLVQEARIYEADVHELLRVVNALPDAAASVMLFGHNPGFTHMVEFFSSELIGNLPTCGMVRIDMPISSWREASQDMGAMVWMDYPKRHPEGR
jgi:phosphohistidine phosphatase